MKILHYFLGFPPYRSGGLTKYACDLMQAQAQRGDTVMALWPGRMGFLSKKVSIRHRGAEGAVESYELCNPLPVPLDEGILSPAAFMQSCDMTIFTGFLQQLHPDAIHIHTLMGLYREFVLAAKALGIRTVFTSHDYFGLCPKVTMFHSGKPCAGNADCSECPQCNLGALSLTKIRLLQSSAYRTLKDSPLMRTLRKQHRQAFFEDSAEPATPAEAPAATAADYCQLRSYYISILSDIDTIHFNSSVAQQVYSRFLTPKDGRNVSITHKDIADHRSQPATTGEKLRLLYLAPAKPFKGYTIIRQALDQLWNSGKRDFVLKLFGPVHNPAPYMQVLEEPFRYEKLGDLFAEADALLAPSVWYETFGFTVLEALSFGTPVIVSSNLGAKDIIGNGGIIVPPGDPKALAAAISTLTPATLQQLRCAIKSELSIKTWSTFIDENYSLYCEKQ